MVEETLGGKTLKERTIQSFEPEYRAKTLNKYKASISLKHGLSCAQCFNTYEQSRIKGIDDFSTIKAPDGISLADKLKGPETEAGGKARAEIAKALQSDSLEKGGQEFNSAITGLVQLLAKGEFRPGEIGSYLIQMKTQAVDAINDQHKQAKAKLEELFANPDFKANLNTSLNNPSDAQREAIKTEMLAALDKKKQDELTKLEKAIEENVKFLSNLANENEVARLSYLLDRYHQDPEMKEEINKQLGKETSVKFNLGDSDLFKDVDVNKLEVINTMDKDRKITKLGDGTYSMESNRLYQSEESLHRDLLSFAHHTRACGFDSITIKISNSDPEKALRHAQIAYKTHVLAGYSPKKISIIVNDKMKMKYATKEGEADNTELFDKTPADRQKLQFYHEEAARYVKKLEEYSKGTATSNKAIKQSLETLKKEAADEKLKNKQLDQPGLQQQA